MATVRRDIPEDETKLPVVEQFYSIQGEGFHMGNAAYFIRIGGCDIGCHWCDTKFSWDPSIHGMTGVDELVRTAVNYPAKAVVITGGEPLMYNLNYVCRQLKKYRITVYLETSGAYAFSGQWDWICLSPKPQSPPFHEFYSRADELKVIITGEESFAWAEENAALVNTHCQLYLQPEWSRYKKLIPKIADYVLQHPKWKVSLQSHKFMNLP